MIETFVLVLAFSGLAFGDDIPQDNNEPPPSATSPTNSNEQMTGTDADTQSSPSSDMDTIDTQSVGTEVDAQPESHPIPLNQVPNQ